MDAARSGAGNRPGRADLWLSGSENSQARSDRRRWPQLQVSLFLHNELVELIVAPGQAAARLRYTGHHHGVLLGEHGSGAAIEYEGAAFFRCADGCLTSAWVLGDIDRLRGQIHADIPRP